MIAAYKVDESLWRSDSFLKHMYYIYFPAAPIADNIQQTFLDNLLTSYRHMEDSFAIQLLETLKAFEFRTLWNVQDKVFKFERTASETAKGTGKLEGVLQLTKSLEKLEELESKTGQCFTKFRYTTSTDKWSFDNVKDAAVSKL